MHYSAKDTIIFNGFLQPGSFWPHPTKDLNMTHFSLKLEEPAGNGTAHPAVSTGQWTHDTAAAQVRQQET